MNKARFIKLVLAWGDTRNSDLLELIESIYEDLWIETRKTKNNLNEFHDMKYNISKLAKDLSAKNGEVISNEFISKLIHLYAQRPVNAEPVGCYCTTNNAMEIYESAGAASKLTNEKQPSITRAAQSNNKLNGKIWFKIFKGNEYEGTD